MHSIFIPLGIAVFTFCGVWATHAQHVTYDESSGAHFGFIPWVAPQENCAPLEGLFNETLLRQQRLSLAKFTAEETLKFGWPVDGILDVDNILHNYIDLDPSNAIRDYMGKPHAYNGHRGTDISIRSFRDMDQGVPIFAAEAGVVNETRFGFPDRNTAWAPDLGPQWNGAVLLHNEDTGSAYLHFRTNSLTVEPGETVEKGQLLGYMGSSGFSTNPHLHFEVLKHDGDNWIHRDPWHGTNNPLPSKWAEQPLYVGDDPMKVYDIGIATRASMGGNLNQFRWELFLERLSEPAVFGTDENQLVVWFLAQNPAGAQYRLQILRPNGTVWNQAQTTIAQKYAFGIWYWYFNMNQAMENGIWEIRMLEGDGQGNFNRVLYERTFELAAETEWGPRFLPAGKSIRIDGESKRDTLRMSPFTGSVTYHFVNQPAYANIEQDSIVVFQGSSHQTYRSDYFQIVATDEHARTDTMYYHVVDPSKPLDPVATSSEQHAVDGRPERLELAQNYPNPFNPSTRIAFAVPASGHVTLRIYDALGRQIAIPVDGDRAAGHHAVTWNAGGLPSGVYFYRIESSGSSASGKMLLVK